MMHYLSFCCTETEAGVLTLCKRWVRAAQVSTEAATCKQCLKLLSKKKV